MKKLILITIFLSVSSCATNSALKRAKTSSWGPTSIAKVSSIQSIGLENLKF